MARLLASQDATLRQLRQMLLKPATTEKTRVVLERAGVKPESDKPTQPKKIETQGPWAAIRRERLKERRK